PGQYVWLEAEWLEAERLELASRSTKLCALSGLVSSNSKVNRTHPLVGPPVRGHIAHRYVTEAGESRYPGPSGHGSTASDAKPKSLCPEVVVQRFQGTTP